MDAIIQKARHEGNSEDRTTETQRNRWRRRERVREREIAYD